LGLAIVSELAGAMGAGVRAESPVAEGRGTRMVVWFGPGGTAASTWIDPAAAQPPSAPGSSIPDPGRNQATPPVPEPEPAAPPMITAAALFSPPPRPTPDPDREAPAAPVPDTAPGPGYGHAGSGRVDERGQP
jgi:hypothetical protein